MLHHTHTPDEARRLAERDAVALAARSGGTRAQWLQADPAGDDSLVQRFRLYEAAQLDGAGPAQAWRTTFGRRGSTVRSAAACVMRAQAQRVLSWLAAFTVLGGAMLLAAWMAASESLSL